MTKHEQPKTPAVPTIRYSFGEIEIIDFHVPENKDNPPTLVRHIPNHTHSFACRFESSGPVFALIDFETETPKTGPEVDAMAELFRRIFQSITHTDTDPFDEKADLLKVWREYIQNR